MDLKINVAGDSPSLKWLVNQCLKASPAIQLESGHISIDWKKALASSGMGDVASQRVLPILLNMSDCWPLEFFNSGYERHMGQRDKFKTSIIPAKPKPLPKEFKDMLKDLLKVMDGFVRDLDMEGSFYRYELDFSLQIKGWKLYQECEWLKLQLFPTRYEVEFRPRLRLDVALASMTNFITGESSVDRYAAPAKDRHKIWQYANIVSDLHYQLHTRLESLIQSTGTAAASEDSWASCAGIIERLGQVEEKLASTMSGERHGGRGDLNVFAIKEALRVNQRKSKLKVPDHLKNYLKQSPGTPLNSSGLRQWIEWINSHVLAFQDDARLRRKVKFAEVLGVIEDFMEYVGDDLDWEIVEDINQKPDPVELSRAMHRVIRSHPLLILLHSGFLTVYSPKPTSESFYLGLSPWVIANVMARKCIGRPIMKYAGYGEVEEAASVAPS